MIELQETKKEQIVTLSDDQTAENRLSLRSLEEVIEAHRLLSDYLVTKKATEFIGNKQAQQIAEDEGYQIPITTLVNACTRGTIVGAHKRKGRWYIPRTSFDTWFQEWKTKQQDATRFPQNQLASNLPYTR